MKVEIFIVTYKRDFQWLYYCLKSIARHASGFSGVTLLVPTQDRNDLASITDGFSRLPLTVKTGDEWEGKGMLWHMAQIMRSDEWVPDADYIAHFDADCMFVDPVTPDDYFKDGRPIMYYESFESIGKKFPEVMRWQQVVQDCVTFPVKYETMRRPFLIYSRSLYVVARLVMAEKTGMHPDSYIEKQRNEFPQTFCEFNTLGNVAYHFGREVYEWYDLEKNPWPMQKVVQFWSHAPPTKPQAPLYHGKPFQCTPDYFLK